MTRIKCLEMVRTSLQCIVLLAGMNGCGKELEAPASVGFAINKNQFHL